LFDICALSSTIHVFYFSDLLYKTVTIFLKLILYL